MWCPGWRRGFWRGWPGGWTSRPGGRAGRAGVGHGWREAPRPALPWGSGKREGSPWGLLLCLRAGPSMPPDGTPVSHPASPRSSAVRAPWALPAQCQNQRPHGISVSVQEQARPSSGTLTLAPSCLSVTLRALALGLGFPLERLVMALPLLCLRAAGEGSGPMWGHALPAPLPPLGWGWTPVLSAPPNCPFCLQEDLVSTASPGARSRLCGLRGRPGPRWGGLRPLPGTGSQRVLTVRGWVSCRGDGACRCGDVTGCGPGWVACSSCHWPTGVGQGQRAGAAVSWRLLPGPAGARSALAEQRGAAWPPASRRLPPNHCRGSAFIQQFPESWGLRTPRGLGGLGVGLGEPETSGRGGCA